MLSVRVTDGWQIMDPCPTRFMRLFFISALACRVHLFIWELFQGDDSEADPA